VGKGSQGKRLKVGVLFLLPIVVFASTYYLKSYLNQTNLKNKNYLATSIRTQNVSNQDVRIVSVGSALDRQGFIKYCQGLFAEKKQPLKIYLTDLTNFTDEDASEQGGQVVGVRVYIADGIIQMFVERSYSTESQSSSGDVFKILSKGTLDLQQNVMSYRVLLVDDTMLPDVFIGYLRPLSEEIQLSYPANHFVSKIRIESSDGSYIYYSDKPNRLIRIENVV